MIGKWRMIKWHDGERTIGESATDCLRKLCGGFNPASVSELKVVLAKRGAVTPPSNAETDEAFLQRLADHGMFEFRPFDDRA